MRRGREDSAVLASRSATLQARRTAAGELPEGAREDHQDEGRVSGSLITGTENSASFLQYNTVIPGPYIIKPFD